MEQRGVYRVYNSGSRWRGARGLGDGHVFIDVRGAGQWCWVASSQHRWGGSRQSTRVHRRAHVVVLSGVVVAVSTVGLAMSMR